MKMLVCGLMLLPVLAFAQPSVSGISDPNNRVTNNGSVSISGSAFGVKPNPAPLKFDNFEAGSPGAKLAVVQPEWVPIYNADLGGALYSNLRSHSGSLAAYNAVNRPDRVNPTDGEWESNWFRTPESNTIFISYWMRVESTGGTGIHKMCRITSSAEAGGGGVYNMEGSYALGGNVLCDQPYMSVTTDIDARPTEPALGNTYLNTAGCGAWMRVDMGRTLNDPGVANGWLMGSIVGKETLNFENNQNLWNAGTHAGKSLQLNTVLLGTMVANFVDGNNTAIWIDDIYIDNTRARVELGNNAVFANCTHREMQYPTAWTNTGISITVNAGTIPPGAAWLFVVNASGQVSSGFPVTVATGTAELGPGKPGTPIPAGG